MSTKNTVVTLLCLTAIALTGCESMKPTYKEIQNPNCPASDVSKSCRLYVPFNSNDTEIKNTGAASNALNNIQCKNIEKTNNGYMLTGCI